MQCVSCNKATPLSQNFCFEAGNLLLYQSDGLIRCLNPLHIIFYLFFEFPNAVLIKAIYHPPAVICIWRWNLSMINIICILPVLFISIGIYLRCGIIIYRDVNGVG